MLPASGILPSLDSAPQEYCPKSHVLPKTACAQRSFLCCLGLLFKDSCKTFSLLGDEGFYSVLQ